MDIYIYYMKNREKTMRENYETRKVLKCLLFEYLPIESICFRNIELKQKGRIEKIG